MDMCIIHDDGYQIKSSDQFLTILLNFAISIQILTSNIILCPFISMNTVRNLYVPFRFFLRPVSHLQSEYSFHDGVPAAQVIRKRLFNMDIRNQ